MATGSMYVYAVVHMYNLNCAHVFRVYFAGCVGPIVFVLHGGGHSALSWALFTVSDSTLTHYTKHSCVTAHLTYICMAACITSSSTEPRQ